jgi:tRNA 5-methylaminomethyl-2-thiouridine biosynthesis bifunctional protein
MPRSQHHDIVVIGAGIAGTTIAQELLNRGQSVCIIDSAAGPATGCSNHDHAIAHPHIGRGSPRLLQLTRIAFLLAESRWGKHWHQHGIFQPTKKGAIFDGQKVSEYLHSLGLDESIAIPLSAQEAQEICGLEQSGVWLSRGASLSLSATSIAQLQKHEQLTCIWNTRITTLQKVEKGWSLSDQNNCEIVSADQLIITAAMGSQDLMSSCEVRLPLRPVRGQLSIFSISQNNAWADKLPRVGISGDGYCLPATLLPNGTYQWMVGSSFDEGEADLDPRESSDEFNREQAKGLINYVDGDARSLETQGSFVGIRCVAGDRLPIIGALTQRPGIFLATAFGSRGILWSALAAKLITAQVLEDDFALLTRLGLTADLLAALSPARFFAGALAAPAALGALASNSKPIFPSDPKAR